MSRDTLQTLRLIFKMVKDKKSFVFWLFIRFLSAGFPILTIYLYSRVVNALETGADFHLLFSLVIFVLISRLLDNFTRLVSTNKLDYVINNIQLDIQNIMVYGVKASDRKTRHKAIQAIRNFADATSTTLTIFKQPGIDALVSFITIPFILFLLDFKVFVIQAAYVIIYYFTDIYTTEKYTKLKNRHNSTVESYFAKFQTAKNFKFEQTLTSKAYLKVANWGIIEWLLLQNTAVLFYILTLIYLVFSFSQGTKSIADIVLIIGYLDGTQSFLNNISSIKDSMANTKVALHRLLDNQKSLAVDYDDLTS